MQYKEYYSNRDVISLFSGAMGLDIGLQQAGLNVVIGQDFEPACVETMRANGHKVLGGDIREILNKTRTIINDKIIIQEEIETVVAAPKMWQNFMLIAPVALTALIKYSSTDFKNSFATEAGFAATTGAIAIFIASYFLGKKIMNVKL